MGATEDARGWNGWVDTGVMQAGGWLFCLGAEEALLARLG